MREWFLHLIAIAVRRVVQHEFHGIRADIIASERRVKEELNNQAKFLANVSHVDYQLNRDEMQQIRENIIAFTKLNAEQNVDIRADISEIDRKAAERFIALAVLSKPKEITPQEVDKVVELRKKQLVPGLTKELEAQIDWERMG